MIRQNVKLSTYSVVITWLCIFVMAALPVYGYMEGIPNWVAYGIASIFMVMIIFALFYMPLDISADDRKISLNFILRSKHIQMGDVASVMLCPPTMAERRIWGSGGFFGYWGWFSEPSIGKYFAYYGKASDCFLVRMKNGRNYLLGCENAPEMVNRIESYI